MHKSEQRGMTLVELMIVVVIIGILAAIGYPSYASYVVRSNRSAAQSFTYQIANKQEQYMLDARRYAGGTTAFADLNITQPQETSGKYTFSVTCTMATATGNCTALAGPPTFTITATPQGNQAAQDTKCGVLTLNSAGTKTEGGTAASASECW